MKRILIAIALALASATSFATSPIPAEYNRLNSLFWKGECTGTLYMHGDGNVRKRPCWGSLKAWATSNTLDLSGEFFWSDGNSPEDFAILFSFPQDNDWWDASGTASVSSEGVGGLRMINSGNGFNIYDDDDLNSHGVSVPQFDWAFGSEQDGTFFWFGNWTSTKYIDNGFHSGVHVPGPVQMPEPGTLALLGLGAFGLAAVRIKRREHAAAK